MKNAGSFNNKYHCVWFELKSPVVQMKSLSWNTKSILHNSSCPAQSVVKYLSVSRKPCNAPDFWIRPHNVWF